MKTRSALMMHAGTKESLVEYEVADVVLDDPRQGELLVKMVASGLCHSDDHFTNGDFVAATYPFVVGHEGAGIVQEVGPNTPGYEEGDHVIFSFVPSCGRCRWCASGMQNLCDLGALTEVGSRPDDQTSFRVHLPDGTDVGQMAGIGTFSEFTTVNVASAVKVAKDLPLETVCLLGCGVGTGWGSAVNSADVKPSDTVIIMGIGGIGINAVQGAAFAGASNVIAVDPVAFKREKALELGATHAFESIAEAEEFAKSQTNGQGADSAIVTIGVVKGEHVAQAFAAIRKAGTVVVTGLGGVNNIGIPVDLTELTLYQKRIQGSIYGQCNPTYDIPRQLQMYRDGRLKLDELVTNTYQLDEVAQGYRDMKAGKNIRGVVVFPS